MDLALIIAGLAVCLLLFGVGLCCLIKRCCRRRKQGRSEEARAEMENVEMMASHDV